MKDDDTLPVSTPTSTSGIPLKKDSSSAAITAAADHSSLCFGRGRYKFWALGAILLLAFWSMLTGTVTLRLSAANLNHLSNRDSFDSPLPDDLDALVNYYYVTLCLSTHVYTQNADRFGFDV